MTESPDKDKTLASDFEFTELARDGLRLLKAFRDIADPSVRTLVIDFAERLAHEERSKAN